MVLTVLTYNYFVKDQCNYAAHKMGSTAHGYSEDTDDEGITAHCSASSAARRRAARLALSAMKLFPCQVIVNIAVEATVPK
jgi:hypothetical protein